MFASVGRQGTAGTNTNPVRDDGRREVPLQLFPTEHAQLFEQRRRQELRLVFIGRRPFVVQQDNTKARHVAQYAIRRL